jgi:flagellar biosynthesis protein FlhG
MTSASVPPPSMPPPSEPPEAEEAFSRGVRALIVVGGGRGGVGKSLVAQNLAIYLAQLGKSVVLVDADPTGTNIHTHFGLAAARAEPELSSGGSAEALERALVPTAVPGLSLLPAAHDAVDPPMLLRGGRKARWLAMLRRLPVDYLVVDVGPGQGHLALDVMVSADLPILVTVPEPPAVEATYRFLRASFRRRVRRSLLRDRFRLKLVDRAYAEIGRLAAPLELVRHLATMDRTAAEAAWAEARRTRGWLVVNQTRVRSDLELGAWMSELAARHFGVGLEELGHVEHDDTVWLTVRRMKPLLVDSPTSRSGRNLERIARRVVALLTTPAPMAHPTPLPLAAPTLYEVLGVERSASDEDIRRAVKRHREVYAAGGLATVSLFDEKTRASALARIDEAHDTLLDPVRRRAYDLSTFPDDAAPSAPRPVARPALAAEQLLLAAQLLRELGPDTEFTGELLRKVRESQGLDLSEISARTKIARAQLEALEDEAFEQLPAGVYVRGFLGEYAKVLKLDPAQVQRTYLRRMRERGTAGKAP